MLLGAVGLVTLTTIGPDTAYASHVLPGILIVGAGMGLVFSSAMATATLGVQPSDAGVASAMVNTMQQIGGSIGTALLSTLAAAAVTSDLAASATARPDAAAVAHAAVHGYTTAFWWAAAIYAVGAVVCASLLTKRSREVVPAGETAFAGAR